MSRIMLIYSSVLWALLKWKPRTLNKIMAISSVADVVLITYASEVTAVTGIPFYLWYIFYVLGVAIRYGWQHSVLALSASIVSFTLVAYYFDPQSYGPNLPMILGFTLFLLVLALMFGRISEKQFNYQARLAVVDEFRADLASLATSRDILDHLLVRTRELLNVEDTFFLPAQRGADGSEAPGLRSSGADPVLLGTFREGGGEWNVERILARRETLMTNNVARDPSFGGAPLPNLGSGTWLPRR